MPRNRKVYYNISDISIKDYADADQLKSNGRIRKSVSTPIKIAAAAVVASDEYEALDVDDVLVDITAKKLSKSKSSNATPATADPENEHTYNDFPNDIWFLISEFVAPEDVPRFALICKQTYAITTTLKFWKNLYRRYYKAGVELPVRLQLDCMARPRGVRACTIRSLFFTYPLFANRTLVQPQQDFHTLVKRRVVQFWFQQVSPTKFWYFYKLKRKLQPGTRTYDSEQLQRRDEKSMKALRDVYYNTEEGCSLLMIESTKFHPLPQLEVIEYESNVVLSSIVNHLSRSCSHYRLEMQFSNISGTKLGSVVYEPAASIRVYDWWAPTYAKYVRQGLQPSLEYVKDEKDTNDDNDQDGTDDDAWDYVINNF